MARVRTVFRCSDCGGAAPKWAGRCPACGEWNTLVEERDDPAAAAGRVGRRRGGRHARAHRRGGHRRLAAPAHRPRRGRPGALRRPRAGFGHPRGRRAGHGEVDAAPADRLGPGRRGRDGAVRVGGGVQAAGAAAGRAARHPAAQAVAGRRHLARPRDRPPRLGAARRGGDRLDADHLRPGAVVGARIGGPGARVRRPPRARGQGPGDRAAAGRPRHQGRRPRRPAGAGAPGRHRAVVRG